MQRTFYGNLRFWLTATTLPLAFASPSHAADASATAPPVKAATTSVADTSSPNERIRTVKVDDFEDGVRDWTPFKIGGAAGFGPDLEAKVDVTSIAGQVKSGKNALSYIYDVQPKSIGMLALQRPLDLSGMKSVRFAIRCDAATVVAFGLRESGGARYSSYFYCPAKKWQNISFDLSEMKQDDESKDDNDRLDVDKISQAFIVDAAGFFAGQFSRQTGAHQMWLDDIEYSSQPVAPIRAASTHGAGTLSVDDFESGAMRWLPLLLQIDGGLKIEIVDSAMTLEKGTAPGDVVKDGGKQELKIPYNRRPGTAAVWLRNLQSLDKKSLKQATVLGAALKVSKSGIYMLSLKEKDGSRYQQIIELKAADDWKNFVWLLSGFKVADDSSDENGKLDMAQVEELGIGDLTALLPQAVPAKKADVPAEDVVVPAEDVVTLWIDDVRFETEKAPAVAAG